MVRNAKSSWIYFLSVVFPIFTCFIFKAQAYVGGSTLSEDIHGLVKFSPGDVFTGSCSGTFVSNRHIVTASHCVTLSVDGILDLPNRIFTGPHFPRRTEIAVFDVSANDYTNLNIEIAEAHFYQAFYARQTRLNHYPELEEVLQMGDIAILELENEVENLPGFTSVHIGPVSTGDNLWVGGFGKRGPIFDGNPLLSITYQGGHALVGNSLGEVAREIINREEEVTYLAPGDSGGGVFRKVNNSYQLVGVNHSSPAKRHYSEIQQDPANGNVLVRDTREAFRTIGTIHSFDENNALLKTWLELILGS